MVTTSTLGKRIGHLMTVLGVTHVEFGQVMGASARTIERWLADETYPQHDSRQKLDALSDLVDRLDEMFPTADSAAQWLHSPAGYFGGLCPLDALLRGRIDLVDAALEALDSGIFV